MSRKLFPFFAVLLIILINHQAHSQEFFGPDDPRLTAEYIGSKDPRFKKQMEWFENDLSKGPQDSFIIGELYFYLGGNVLRPFIRFIPGKTAVNFVDTENYVLRLGDDYEFTYLIKITDGDKDYEALMRTRKGIRPGTKGVIMLQSQMLYLSDKHISSTEYFRILPEFLQVIKQNLYSMTDRALGPRMVFIDFISGDANSKESHMIWTLFGLQRKTASAEIKLTRNTDGSIKLVVKPAKGNF